MEKLIGDLSAGKAGKGVIVDGVVYDRVSSTKIPDDYFRVKFVEFLDANGWMFIGITIDAGRRSEVYG